MTHNKLQLNNDKTELIFVVPKHLQTSVPLPESIQLDESTIPTSKTVRNLGVFLDQTLSFKKQISSVCQSCYLELRRISSIRHLLSKDATKTLVCALVLSRLDYCNSLLAGCPKYLLNKLQKIQNYAARLIFRSPKSAHITPVLHSLHWLPIERRINYKLSLLSYKFMNDSSPTYFNGILNSYSPSRQLRSSTDTHLLKIPSYRTKSYGHRTFSLQAASVWNGLPYSVRHSASLLSFKSSLKTHLFPPSPSL